MCYTTYMLYGVDVSSYQEDPTNANDTIDWHAVASSGQQFAWAKSSEGTRYVNPYFQQTWRDIQAAGMARGAYHFARPDDNLPENEVDFFLRNVGDLQPTDLVALDLESGSGSLLNWTIDWLKYCEQRVGFKPLLYSGTWFLQPHDCLNSSLLASYPLWLSGYQSNMPAVPDGWNTIAMWQFTDKATIPGIQGDVDQSVFLGSLDDLHTYGKQGVSMDKSVSDQLVTILSVIGDATYNPDGSAADMNSQMPNQQVARIVFVRELVQNGKALLGA